MFSHVMLGTNDLAASMAFYDPVMATLGFDRVETGETYIGYGHPEDIGSGVNCLFISHTFDGQRATIGNGVNVALLAQTRAQVEAFHAAALANGGSNEGEPGLRDIHPNFYAAYVRDPLGNKLTIVCHSEHP